MPNFRGTEKPGWRVRYQYELISAITGQNKKAIRQKMWRMGLSNETEDFAKYIILHLEL